MNRRASAPHAAVGSATILIVESAMRIAITALVSFWLARQLGPQGFGLLNAAMAATSIFIVIAAMGLDVPAVVRLARAESPASQAQVLATVVRLRALAVLPALAAATLLAWMLHGDDPHALHVSLVMALSIVGYAPSVLDVWFRSRMQALPLASARLGATLLSAALKLYLLSVGADLVWLAWAVVAEACLFSALITVWLLCSRQRPRLSWQWDRALAHALVRQSAPLLLAAAVVMVYMKSDVVLLSALSDHTQTGLYALAQKMSEVLYIVPVAIIDSLYPLLAARSRASAPAHADQLMFDLGAAGAWLAVGCGLLLAVPLVRWVFGEAYSPTLTLFAIHAWTCLAIALDTARQRWLVTAGLQRRAPWLAGSGALLAIGLNLALVPWLGALGAACTALAASLASAVVSSFFWTDLREVGRMQCRALWPWGRLWRQVRRWRQQSVVPTSVTAS